MPLNFKVSAEDSTLIRQIVERAHSEIFDKHPNIQQTHMDTTMDLTVTHNNVNLDLVGLLAAPQLDFTHDILGIRRHINRQNGDLENCFVPRYARSKQQ